MRSNESPSDVIGWLQSEAANVWPAMLGSLSLRRAPCVRENCKACRSGEQHPSYVLYGKLKVRRCLDNGRALQALLFEVAPRYIKALKRQKSKSAKELVR
jgi:hypothetical protein